MPFRYQKMIFAEDLLYNRDVIYLFGDNEERDGYGGQAREMRGKLNARGVRTKRSPSNLASSFWSDTNYEKNRIMIDNDLEGLWQFMTEGGTVVCPLDGLGTGLSALDEHAPKTLAYLKSRILDFEHSFDPKKGVKK